MRILSMTGFGEARFQAQGLEVSVELRTINNRYLKISSRVTDGYAGFEPKIEELLRGQIRRGTVQVSLRVRREATADDYRLNLVVLESYLRQAEKILADRGAEASVSLESLLMLPGVVQENAHDSGDADWAEQVWPMAEQALCEAVENLQAMRTREGAAMAADLAEQCDTIAVNLAEVEKRASLVVDHYRSRLTDRLNKVLAEFELSLDAADVIKEVSIFADRSDISEEIVRLKSHLKQFARMMEEPDSPGKRLEFLTQEMVRETNTIGSKANDVDISRHVIEIKAALERIREQVQNVE